MIWPFKRKQPPAPPAPPKDTRVWNDDWSVGDTAECVVEWDAFTDDVKPWERPAKGQRLTVSGFSEKIGKGTDSLYYFLSFSDWAIELPTQAFRKVRPVTQAIETSIGAKILKAKPAPDRKRKVSA